MSTVYRTDKKWLIGFWLLVSNSRLNFERATLGVCLSLVSGKCPVFWAADLLHRPYRLTMIHRVLLSLLSNGPRRNWAHRGARRVSRLTLASIGPSLSFHIWWWPRQRVVVPVAWLLVAVGVTWVRWAMWLASGFLRVFWSWFIFLTWMQICACISIILQPGYTQ